MTVRYFDPKGFIITFAGYPLQDFASDFFEASYDEARFRLVKGIDGDAARVKNKLRSGTLVVRLLASSPSNDWLSTFHYLDDLTGFGVLPFLARDKNGGTSILAASTFIESIPPITFSNGEEIREWRILTDNLIMFLAGYREEGIKDTALNKLIVGLKKQSLNQVKSKIPASPF
jgi:hypothetical protein